jgi:hypothetical protein
MPRANTGLLPGGLGYGFWDFTMTTHKLLLDIGPWVVPIAIALVCRVLLLCIALLILLRMQDLNYSIPGLIASATLASAFDLIPFVGHPAAVAVLLLCLLKMTRAHLVDVRFTVMVSYAVMFLMQMLILSAIPGDLRAHARSKNTDQVVQETPDGAEPDDEDTNIVAVMPEQSVASATTNVISTNIAAVKKVPEPAKAEPIAVVRRTSTKPATEIVKGFKLNGVLTNARESTAIFNTGVKTYTVKIGDEASLETPDGRVEVRLEKVTQDAAVFSTEGDTVVLRLR